MSYLELLKHPLWQRKRLEIMKRDNFTCQKCGDQETMLNVHHKQYSKKCKPWEYSNHLLITVCEDCHLVIEHLKNKVLIDEISIFKSNKIIFVNYCEIEEICYINNSNELILYHQFLNEILILF